MAERRDTEAELQVAETLHVRFEARPENEGAFREIVWTPVYDPANAVISAIMRSVCV